MFLALKRIVGVNGKVYNKGKSHAKYYIFDNKKVIITSGNLTRGGLSGNYEYGVFVDDRELVNQSCLDYNDLIDDIKPIELDSIKEIENIANGIKQIKQPKLPDIKHLLKDDNRNLEINSSSIESQLKGWKKDLFRIIDQLDNDDFSINNLYNYKDDLLKLHPGNNNIEAKIRQIFNNFEISD